MSKLLIRDRIDGDTTDEVNSPDILVVPSIWENIEVMKMDYNTKLQAAVSTNQWGFVYVRVKNNCGETLNNIYVTASFSNDALDGSNRKKALQTVDGMASTFVPQLEPGEWVVTEQPFILNRDGDTSKIIYVRACEEKMEFPCNDGSSSESYVKFSVIKGTVFGKIQEGFIPVVNYLESSVWLNISVQIDITLSESQQSDVVPSVELYNNALGINKNFASKLFDLDIEVPANCSENLYYSILIPEEMQENGDETTIKQSVAIVFKFRTEG